MEKATFLRLGVIVLVGLAVLTAVEFWVAVGGLGGATLALLSLVALAKAALIVDYFMHVGKLFHQGDLGQPESGGH